MSEHKRTVPDAGACKYADLRTKSNQELLAEVDAIMEQDAAHMDVERLDACLDLLQERAPVAQSYDPDASWREFSRRHALILEQAGGEEQGGDRGQDKPVRSQQARIGRRVLLIAALVVLALGIMVSVQASGRDVFGAFAQWTEETFHFTSQGFSGLVLVADAAEAETPAAAEEPAAEEVDFEALVAEFEELGVPRDLVLTWVPEGYVVNYGPKVDNTIPILRYEVSFISSTAAEIQFSIQQYSNSEFNKGIIFEKNNTSVDQYVSQDRLFYLYGNTDSSSRFATWSFNEYIIEISGDNLSSSDLKQIIDSIGAES